jgi:hypothetical protein
METRARALGFHPVRGRVHSLRNHKARRVPRNFPAPWYRM